MKIISPSRFDDHVDYFLHFDRLDSGSGGFSFPCDAAGNVDAGKLFPAGRDNYQACLAGTNGTKRVGVVPCESHNRIPAVGECPCGAQVELAGFTNTCTCGRDFNGSGQELAPREQWGEETGETWHDCYHVPENALDSDGGYAVENPGDGDWRDRSYGN